MAKITKLEYRYNGLGYLVDKRIVEVEITRDWQTPEHSVTERELMDAYMDYLLTNSWD